MSGAWCDNLSGKPNNESLCDSEERKKLFPGQ